MLTLPTAWAGPVLHGRLRAAAEDFIVCETLGWEPSGSGEHLLLRIRKQDANTAWVARELARACGLRAADVGFSGTKDRRAITEQWFSVRGGAAVERQLADASIPGVEFLAATRHTRKLRRGAHVGNAFRLTLRDVSGDRERAATVLGRIRAGGMPNYFGAQRFGRGGANLRRAEAGFSGGRWSSRSDRAWALSAARAAIFNAVLAARVADGTWNRLRVGDIAGLEGSRSQFPVTETESLEERLQQMDVHPTGPLWGAGAPGTTGDVATSEQRIATHHPVFAEGLERAGVEASRRHLRIRVRGLCWLFEGDRLTLEFSLPPGVYATSLVRELMTEA